MNTCNYKVYKKTKTIFFDYCNLPVKNKTIVSHDFTFLLENGMSHILSLKVYTGGLGVTFFMFKNNCEIFYNIASFIASYRIYRGMLINHSKLKWCLNHNFYASIWKKSSSISVTVLWLDIITMDSKSNRRYNLADKVAIVYKPQTK